MHFQFMINLSLTYDIGMTLPESHLKGFIEEIHIYFK